MSNILFLAKVILLTLRNTSFVNRPMSPTRIEFKSYCEDEDYLVEGKPEPTSRSQYLIYHSTDSRWWVKVTFRGELHRILASSTTESRPSKRERRKMYQNIVNLIDYASLPLLDDTVTEVILEEPLGKHNALVIRDSQEPCTAPFASFLGRLGYKIREDPSRVVYPSCIEYTSFRPINVTDLSERVEIVDGVFRVLNVTDKMPYILKVVNRSLYWPHGTDVIRKELENIHRFRGVPNIVQAAGIAVSDNPYKTSRLSYEPQVAVGIVLEFYEGGSLRDVLKGNRLTDITLRRWALQIAIALNHMHQAGIAHMDIKLSNVVIDAGGDAVVIDISGIGGVTYAWRAPEIRDEISPCSLPFEVRQSNDVWAYGKLLSEMASYAEDGPMSITLNEIADGLTRENAQNRMTLLEAVSSLEDMPI
ncbi:serine/threonine protein kinase [Aspergillus terreus]|uniref:Serine/threonine protein kinase n=1 Tax=Aspergillus terreus TaxID=33178 RepID=A0A5M3Z2A9_ASPTE|nr:hypothetical protein ATETN484_0008003800 [Aspergillus terreus]GFF16441.1 serine/threonine protein kinase [Aspergillus terreus]